MYVCVRVGKNGLICFHNRITENFWDNPPSQKPLPPPHTHPIEWFPGATSQLNLIIPLQMKLHLASYFQLPSEYVIIFIKMHHCLCFCEVPCRASLFMSPFRVSQRKSIYQTLNESDGLIALCYFISQLLST